MLTYAHYLINIEVNSQRPLFFLLMAKNTLTACRPKVSLNEYVFCAEWSDLMARPTKWRKIENVPAVPYFIPSDKDEGKNPKNILKLEELEAIRLKDLEGLEQSECADKMEVSRPTFQRILLSAREKIADSLVNGKTIHIEGGNYTRNICPVRCLNCGKGWMESYENMESIKIGEHTCPYCSSNRIICAQSCKGRFCRGHCHRHGRREE